MVRKNKSENYNHTHKSSKAMNFTRKRKVVIISWEYVSINSFITSENNGLVCIGIRKIRKILLCSNIFHIGYGFAPSTES